MPADSRLFRKTSLDRLSSPDQLDRLIQVTTPRGWLALVALAAICGAGMIWGVVGRIPTRISGRGILLKSGGLLDIVSLQAGQLTDVYVEVGEEVTTGQIVARIAQPELVEQVEKARSRLREVEGDQRRRLGFDREEARLREESLNERRESVDKGMASAAERARWLEEKVEAQEQLVRRGLITKQSLLATRQQLAATRQEVSQGRNDLRQITVEKHEIRSRADRGASDDDARVNESRRALEILEQKLELASRVVSPQTGRVVEVRADQGNLIGPGSPIVNLELLGENLKELEVILYVPPAEGKSIRPGMKVQISPSTVKSEEFGYMIAVVTAVADYPASRQGMMRVLENDQLVTTFLTASGGAPIPVRADLVVDPNTPSGYLWSSAKGPPIHIHSGTLCEGRITLREQRPLGLVIPILRQTLGL